MDIVRGRKGQERLLRWMKKSRKKRAGSSVGVIVSEGRKQ